MVRKFSPFHSEKKERTTSGVSPQFSLYADNIVLYFASKSLMKVKLTHADLGRVHVNGHGVTNLLLML